MNLKSFAAQQGPTAGAADRWFDEHTGVIEEVVNGFQSGIPADTVWRWLRDEYDYPLSNTTIHRLRGRLLR